MEESGEKKLKYYELLSELLFLSELDTDLVDIFIKKDNEYISISENIKSSTIIMFIRDHLKRELKQIK